MRIRAAEAADRGAIAEVITAAFGRTDEAQIVAGVRSAGAVVAELVAEEAGEVAGTVLFSRMSGDRPGLFVALGPLAVRPDRQRSGVGAALCEAGLAACRAAGAVAIVVLGHPAYYPRFGFSADAARTIVSPYAGAAAFMALALVPGVLNGPLSLAFPEAFGVPARDP